MKHKISRKLIVRRSISLALLGIYIAIALLNSTVVQSYVGAAVSSYFSREWGGKVRIGAIHANPFSHVILDKIELISPTNDTIYYGDRIACRFKKFPFHKTGLSFDRVMLRNGCYHFESILYPSGKLGTNLDYIINYFPAGTPSPEKKTFVVEVGELRATNIEYRMDLPEPDSMVHYDYGVEISHMHFLNTRIHARRIRVENDSIKCRMVSFSTTEISGQHIVDLSADVTVSPHMIRAINLDLQTEDSRVFANACLSYHGWQGMNDYCANVHHEVVLKNGTEVNLCDAAYWAPALWGINCKVAVQGHIYGPVANICADHLVASFGNNSNLFVDGKVKGLPQIMQTSFDIDLHRLHTNYSDLEAVKHPAGIEMLLPDLVKQMSIIDLNGSLKGDMQNCEAFLSMNSLIGDIETQAHLQYDSSLHDYSYYGDIDSRSIGIRSILPNEWVSRTGLHFSFHGTGFNPETMEASLEGRLYNTQFRNHDLHRTTISADIAKQEISADILLKDTLINLDLSATANLADNSYSADVYLTDAHLNQLKLLNTDTNVILTSHLRANLQGNDIENITGSISLSGTECAIGSHQFNLQNLVLDAIETNGFKNVNLNCDWLLMNLKGYFSYSDMPLVVRDFCDRYVPTYYNPFRNADSADLTPLYHDNFDFDLLWTDEDETFAKAMPTISIAPGTSFHGSYNYGEALKLVFRSNQLSFGDLAFNDIGFNSSNLGDNYQFRIRAGNLDIGNNQMLANIMLTTNIGSNISTLALKWNDEVHDGLNEGDLEFFISSSENDNRLLVSKPSFYAMGQRWTLVCPNGVLFNNDRLAIDNIKVYGLDQSISIKALLAGNDDDYVRAAFDDFVLDRLSCILIPNKLLTVEGNLDGLFYIKGFKGVPHFDANLTVDNCVINGQPAGQVKIDSRYHVGDQKLFLDLETDHRADNHHHQPLSLHGFALMNGKDPKLNFSAKIDQVDLTTLGPIIADISSDIDGLLGGEMQLSGTLSNPQIEGMLTISDGHLALSPTGVTYYFDDQFSITNNRLKLSNFIIQDKLNNKLFANGNIILSNGNIALDLNFNTDKLLVLDKESGEGNFYGRLLASAQGTISGPVNDLNISATASTLNNSELYVPIDNKKQVSENEFITFYSPNRTTPQRTQTTALDAGSNNGKVNLLLNLHITPGMKVQLPMDFDQLSAIVNAIGSGDIQVSLQGGNAPTILGNYEFTSGSFSLLLMQLLSKNFVIEEGSTLNFPGDINDAQFHINAVYNLRANLASLMNTVSTSTNDSYVQVQDVIQLSGTIQNPSINFDIRLPNAEQNVTDQVFSYIDRNNERDMFNQSVSLLILGQFASIGSSNDNIGEGFNSISLLANTASSVLTSMVKVVDVDFKYQAATNSAQGQVDVGISKQWNKFYFESSFGYGTSNNQIDMGQGNTLVGDVEVGYKFNPYFDFYGFHRTNTSYYTRTELPYKQGIGVELSKEFDSFLDLVPWIRKKRNKTALK